MNTIRMRTPEAVPPPERTGEYTDEVHVWPVMLQENVDQLGRYLMQMGQMMNAMQRRLDEMEARQAAVTISHAEAKRLQALIRGRADELCRKYNLQDKDSPKIFRAAIKKDLLKRFGVKDLHDLPAAALGRAEALVDSWVNIRLAMERRVST